MEVEIYIEPEGGAPRTERLRTEGRFTIGRHSQCDLYLDGDRISRIHLLVEIRADLVSIEDRSSNGTLVGEHLVHRDSIEVPFGVPIVIGGYTLHIKAASAAQPPAGYGGPGMLRETLPNGMPPMSPLAMPASTTPASLTPMPAASGIPNQAPMFGIPPVAGLPPALPRGSSPGLPPPPLGASAGLPPPPLGASAGLPPPPGHAALQGPGAPLPGAGLPGGARPQPGRPPPPPPARSAPPPPPLRGLSPDPRQPSGKPPGPTLVPPHEVDHRGPGAPPPDDVAQAARAHKPAPPPPEPAPLPELHAAALAQQRVAAEEQGALRREIHAKLIENLDLAKLDGARLDDPSMRPRVLVALRRIVSQMGSSIDPSLDRDALIGELADEALGLGPLERFLADPTVSEIMVVDPHTIFIEQGGKLVKSDARFTDDERVRAVIERIVTPLGRRIDESSPLVDARLKDGSRVNAVIKPLALRGSCITIRKFSKTPLTVEKLVSFGALTDRMARFLRRSVICKKNIIISGGTGSGKTTLLNVLSGAIPPDERVVTIEDAAELRLTQPHVVGLESRPANMEGRGEYTIRDLVRNALRMRPDRIVVGECRGGEALDMLQAMNTGHDGSLTTTHANSPTEAIARIETLALMAGIDLPSRAIREQIATSIHLVVQQTRFSDGSRRIAAISEVLGLEDDGRIELRPIFEYVRTGTGPRGEVQGEHRATGYLPSYLDAFIVGGLVKPGEPYL
jgi:pilus assembly protein CpaF